MIDYLFVGAQKTGSSSFIQYMNQHPDIYCKDGEIHYFDLKFDKKDINWYEKQFKTKKKIIEKNHHHIYWIKEQLKEYMNTIQI